jgi:hypothetical protein
MVRAFELLFTLLQLGPVFVLAIGSNPLSSQLAPTSRQALTKEPECTALSS